MSGPPLPSYRRPLEKELCRRLREPRRFLQVLAGPRQSGKSTLARQALLDAGGGSSFESADEPLLRDRAWLAERWESARALACEDRARGATLVLDEIQKIPDWSETVKRLWDEDGSDGTPLRVVLLGSSRLLVQQGLADSLMGRFEVLHVPHWSYSEMHAAFGWDLDRYLFFGGYPGAAEIASDHARWVGYILEGLIEPTLSRDVLLLSRVDKPALLRQLFRLGCDYSGQALSYRKMVGQLQDAGNTTTLAHYLELLGSAGLLTGLAKFSGSQVRRRASSPKLLVLNTALMTAPTGKSFREAREDPEFWGRLTETAVGAHLVNSSLGTPWRVEYWREGDLEVDFVLTRAKKAVGIEVKSGRPRVRPAGLDAFQRAYPKVKVRMVGEERGSLERLLRDPIEALGPDLGPRG